MTGPRRPGQARKVARATRPVAPLESGRPAPAKRVAAKRTRAPEPQGRFTGRATALILVLGALLLAYAYPMRIYLNQQAQIAALESSQQAQRERIKEKQTQVAKWHDDDYIIAMAHRRLQMVLPGDRAYIITDPQAAAKNPGADPNAGKAKNTGPWYEQLWSSVQAADKPGTGP
jgi:cell division protein FtsB